MDDDQQFCLRWNNHQSTLISVFDTLLENETLVDCTLAAEGKFLKAHKVVLSACSPYFAALLQEQYDKHPIFILKDVKYQELRAMMDYMYRGEVNISQDQLAALLKAAESLQIKGLSDNRSGSGSGASKPEHHRPMGVPVGGAGGLGGSGKPPGAYTLENTKRARVGPSSMDSQSGSREGSSSPSRRRRKARRRSIENAMADVHDNSNSSQIQAQQSSLLQQQQQQQQQQQSNANLAGVGAITAAASALASQGLPAGAMSTGSGVGGVGAGATAASLAAAVASVQGTTQQQLTTSVTKKTESVKGTSDAMITDNLQASSSSLGGVGAGDEQQEMIVAAHHGVTAVKADKQNHKQKGSAGVASKDVGGSEMVIEPKSEFDDEGNDETVEDLTLDEEDIGMDDLDQNAGTSQGAEGSSQGYAAWQHERSQDELLLGAQEAQQRDPQALDLVEPKLEMNSESEERFYCENCGKNYMRKRHLQRHIRDECVDVDPRFSCKLCEAKFRRKYHLVRHLSSRHGLSSSAAQAVATEGTMRGRTTGGGGGNASSSRLFMYKGMPQNLSMSKRTSGKMKSKESQKNRKKPLNNGELKAELLSDANGNQQLTNGVGVGVGVGGGLVLGGAAADAYRRSVEAQALLSAAQLSSAGTGGGGNCRGASPLAAPPPIMGMCGLTDAINAISAAAALVDRRSPIHVGVPNNVTPPLAHNNSNVRTSPTLLHAAAAVQQASQQQQQDQPQELRNYNNNESNVPLPGTTTPADDWSMKFNLQLISNTLLQDRLIKTMPFAYNSNNNSSNN